MRGPLIAESARRGVLALVLAGVVVTAVLAAVVWHGTTTAFDTWAFTRAYHSFGGQFSQRRQFWLLFSEPGVSVSVPLLVLGWSVLTRRWNLAALTLVAPLLALGIDELVLKPLVGRLLGPAVLFGSDVGAQSGAFPSGHETATVAWLLLVVLLVFGESASRRLRAATLAVAVLWALLGALGLTVNYYHYATDTIGAMGATVAIVFTVALVIDRFGAAVDRGGEAVSRALRSQRWPPGR